MEKDGRRTYRLTDAGRTAASIQPGPQGDGAWTGGRGRSGDLHGLTREVRIAAMQVARAGSPAAIDAAGTILAATRRDLYRLLADEPLETAGSGETAGDVEGDTDAG